MGQNDRDEALGLGCPISRRDFVNGALAATGAAALAGCARSGPDESVNGPSGSPWTGYGGVGDYQWANGNTEAVRDAAHTIRDGKYDDPIIGSASEDYDVVIIGGGFTGLTAAYEFARNATSNQRALLLENHPFPGGEAKQNEIDVDGIRVVGPQGSSAAAEVVPALAGTKYETYGNYVRELGIPLHYELQPVGGGAEALDIPNENFEAIVPVSPAPQNFYFGGGRWAPTPALVDFRNTPWPANEQRDVADFFHNRRDIVSQKPDADRWLDSLTYAELLRKLGYGERVIDYVDPFIATGLFGVSSEAVSAQAVAKLGLPGTKTSTTVHPPGLKTMSFPGGNAAIYRAMLKKVVPGAFGEGSIDQLLVTGPIDLAALDRPENKVRIRCASTAVRVEHDGDPKSAGRVLITYLHEGKVRRVRAKAVVSATGGWVNRRMVRDLSSEHAQAFSGLRYGPVMVVNVAVRNWQWLAKRGLPAVRSFSGLITHITARRNFAIGSDRRTITPDTPLMLTLYIPVLARGAAPDAQGAIARTKLLAWSYADIERQIRQEMTELFGPTGFDAKRDIAGVVVNRWGHAYSAPPPGSFFGPDGGPGPLDLLQKPHGRIVFAHSELEGRQNMANAMLQGRRGGLEAIRIANS